MEVTRDVRERFERLIDQWIDDGADDYVDNYLGGRKTDIGFALKSFICENCSHERAEGDIWFEYDFGATRAVVWTEEKDFVLKFNMDDELDYCADEVKLYEYASEKHLNQYLATIQPFCSRTIGSYNFQFYICEYADCVTDKIIDSLDSRKYAEYVTISDYCGREVLSYSKWRYRYGSDDYDVSDDEIFDLFAEEEGWDEREALERFFDSYDVGDFHSANWGRINGRMVIIDYAGFGRAGAIA